MNKRMLMQYKTLSVAAIRRYLELKGWKHNEEFPNKRLLVYVSDVDSFQLAFPADNNLSDYCLGIESLLNSLSSIEDRSKDLIIKDISSVFNDHIEFRIAAEFSQNGSIPLRYAANCIEGVKDLLLYSACAEISAQSVCPKPYKQAKDYIDKVAFNQTEVGSFIINIDVNIIDEDNEICTFEGIPHNQPFEHRVIERIYKSLCQINSVVNEDVSLTELSDTAYLTGITANMCEALGKMQPEDTGAITVDTTFRFASAVTNEVCAPKCIGVNHNHFETCRAISKMYRDKSLFEIVTIQGIVYQLSKSGNGDDEKRTIRILTDDNAVQRKISIILSEANYRIACDAHRDNRRVCVTGTLDKSNKSWLMFDVTNFSEL